MDRHSAKRSTTLEAAPNILDDAIHARLDTLVLKACGDEPVKSIRDLAFLLEKIVSNSQGRLDQKYQGTDARALIKDHPALMDKLKEAWNNRSFKEIRNLKILRVSRGYQASWVPIEQKDAVISAWKQEYHGTAHKVLLEAVDRVYALPIERYYARIVHVTQSSGTGKSRTIDKIATERILLPICLREDLSERDFAYPYADTAVREHLLRAPSTEQKWDCVAYLRSFLCSLFTSACVQAQKFFAAGERVPYTSIAKQFYGFFGDMSSRDDFYDNVIANVDLQKNSCGDVDRSFKLFEDSVQMCCSDWPDDFCPILVSMDDINILFKQDAGSVYTLYSCLRSVLNETALLAFCFIFLSSVTIVPKRAPSEEVPPSMQASANELLLPAPFTELPFDVHLVSEPLVPGIATLASVGSFQFTAKFGRPLFYATYLSRKAQNEAQPLIVSGIMRTVREKLFGGRWSPTSPACLDVSFIAVLSARFHLDLSPTASCSKGYEEELVRSHMWMVYSVHQQGMVTGSTPEPLIAEASAEIMNSSVRVYGNEEAYMDTWKLLVKFVDEGFVPQGTIGVLIGRVLSILAMDRAISALTEHCELEYQTPVTVAAYYKALLTDEAWESLRQSIPVNGERLSKASATTTFEVTFANAYFHFSHYGKANDVTPMQDFLTWALWLRGTAIFCQSNQDLPDRTIPIYFPDFGAVSPKSVSPALEQDKTSQSADPRTIGIQSAENLDLFSQGHKLPYIAAIHCYALTSDEGIYVSTPSPHGFQHPDKNEDAPHYQINFRGLAAYRDVSKDDIQSMIDGSRNALFNHHPRTYGLPSLRQMLPVLSGDSDATLWLGGIGSGKDSS